MTRAKVLIVLFILLILISQATCFGRKKTARCRKDQQVLSTIDENSTDSSDYHYSCDPSEFGIVQKIPYTRSRSCDATDIDFSSACVRCGMCLAIAEKINQTLLDVHEVLPNACLNDTEIELLLRAICDHSFQFYSLREVDGTRYISDRLPGSVMVTTSADGLWAKKLKHHCHYYLDEIGEAALYEQWQQWCNDDEKYPNLSVVMCRSDHGILRDCRSMEDTDKYESPFKTYSAKMKITAAYGEYGRQRK
ncbi:uncharacterized protein LOC108630129 [Ceratina calcarata]|uniref:Uncharacterized protein LOC108630129 n=1 Tax=Ceratina calcarata TaxID=156304 RepID=A0AAJ7JBL1_9HYME|nr:uncharacterized protein LOC108630129 [Ceratina calcarata]